MKSDCLGCAVLLCLVCLTLLASFLSLYIYVLMKEGMKKEASKVMYTEWRGEGERKGGRGRKRERERERERQEAQGMSTWKH